MTKCFKLTITLSMVVILFNAFLLATEIEFIEHPQITHHEKRCPFLFGFSERD